MTDRQQQLLDWMSDPDMPTTLAPGYPAIQWKDAMWKVSDLVRLTGIAGYTYGKCRRDLDVLRSLNLVNQIVPGRWRLGGLS